MTRFVTITQKYTVNGEVLHEETFPLIGMATVQAVGCPPLKVDGASEIEVDYTFDPPLVIPDGDDS